MASQLPKNISDLLKEASQSLEGLEVLAVPQARQLGASVIRLLVVFDFSGSTDDLLDRVKIWEREWTRVCKRISADFLGLKTVDVVLFGEDTSPIIDLPIIWVNGEAKIRFPDHLTFGERRVCRDSTMTHKGLERAHEYTHVLLLTDGLTNSSPQQLKVCCDRIIQSNTKLVVEVVTKNAANLSKVSESQIANFAGLELLSKMTAGSIKAIYITSPNHLQEPFVGMLQQDDTSAFHIVMGVKFPKSHPLRTIFNRILEVLESSAFDKTNAFELIVDMFGLLTPFDRSVMSNPTPFVRSVISRLQTLIPENSDDIISWAQFATQSRLAGSALRAGQRAVFDDISKRDRKALYAAISQELKQFGLNFCVPDSIVLPFVGATLLCSTPRFTESFNLFPKSRDKDGRVSCLLSDAERDEQRIRQSLRQCLNSQGFPSAENCTEVIFSILLMMLQAWLTGAPLERDDMQRLNRLARIQWGMTLPSLTNKDAMQQPILEQLLRGDMPMKSEGSLMDILKKKMDMLSLQPALFWGIIMALLGPDVYAAQRDHFKDILHFLGIEDRESGKTLLEWLRSVFSQHVEGNFTFVDARITTCCVSMEPIVGAAKQVQPHGPMNGCHTNEFISLESYANMTQHFGQGYCSSCRQRGGVVWQDVQVSDPEDQIRQASAGAKPFTLKLDGIELPCMTESGKSGVWSWRNLCIGAPSAPSAPVVSIDPPVVAHAVGGGGAAMRFAAGGGAAAIPVSAGKLQEPPKIHASQSNTPMDVIILRGIVGAGKSTCRIELQAKLEAMGNVVIIINMDKLSKAGLQKQANAIIQKEVKDGQEKAKREGKSFILIVDVCNEHFQMRNPDAFGIPFKKDYKCHVMMPNFFGDDFEGYQAWTLLNVIGRPRPVSEADHWYLTKHGAGLATCIKVSNDKLQKMLVSLGIPSIDAIDTTLSEERLCAQLQPLAERYAQRVAAQGTLAEIVIKYIEGEKIGEK